MTNTKGHICNVKRGIMMTKTSKETIYPHLQLKRMECQDLDSMSDVDFVRPRSVFRKEHKQVEMVRGKTKINSNNQSSLQR